MDVIEGVERVANFTQEELVVLTIVALIVVAVLFAVSLYYNARRHERTAAGETDTLRLLVNTNREVLMHQQKRETRIETILEDTAAQNQRLAEMIETTLKALDKSVKTLVESFGGVKMLHDEIQDVAKNVKTLSDAVAQLRQIVVETNDAVKSLHRRTAEMEAELAKRNAQKPQEADHA